MLLVVVEWSGAVLTLCCWRSFVERFVGGRWEGWLEGCCTPIEIDKELEILDLQLQLLDAQYNALRRYLD